MTRIELARLLRGKSIAHGATRIQVTESDPRKFMAAFARAVAGDAEVFLCNPDWGWMEQKQLEELLKAKPEAGYLKPEEKESAPGSDAALKVSPPSTVHRPPSTDSGLAAPTCLAEVGRRRKPAEGGWLMIPTGGTGGQVRFARHDAGTIAAAVRGFTRHFELPQVNAVGVLSLHHVSGLMAWMRCVLTGGEYLPLDWKAVEGGTRPSLPRKAEGWTLSLVPTQLERLLRQDAAVEWLRGFRIIFLGGAPAWPALLDKAAALRLPLSPGYGMTETAAMIAALRPAEFLAGTRSNGTLLPHARIAFDEEGSILAGGDSVFRGYWPAWRDTESFATQDGGWLDERGHLHVTGRRDAVIISGGEKVNPAEVEAVLRGTGVFADIVVFGVPDTEWGESVVAAYPAETPVSLAVVESALARLLAPAKRPKRFVALADWPVNAQGKVNRARVAELCARL